MFVKLPKFFIGGPLEVDRGSIEEQLLFAKRCDLRGLKVTQVQSNLIVILQALHRTQQHRLLSHTAATEVAAVLGFNSNDGANAVARIIDFYCAARLAFHRQNNDYHPRRVIHVLVDEEIRWRLTLGSDPQVLDPRIDQVKAKAQYHAETQELIRTRFRELMVDCLPPKFPKEASARGRNFGVLKGLSKLHPANLFSTFEICMTTDTLPPDLNQPLMPMREMEPRPRTNPSRRPNPADYTVTSFIERFRAKEAAEAKQAEEDKKAGVPENTAAGAPSVLASSPAPAPAPAPVPASPSSAEDSPGGDRLASESPAAAQEMEGEDEEVLEAKEETPISMELYLAAMQENQYLIRENERLEEDCDARVQELEDENGELDQALRAVLLENRALKREIQLLKDERQVDPHPFEDQVRAIMALNRAREEENATTGAGSAGASHGGQE